MTALHAPAAAGTPGPAVPLAVPDADTARRADLLACIDGNAMPPDAIAGLLQRLCARGAGHWRQPARDSRGRTATHQHEVELFGAFGAGATAIEAARSWTLAARRLAPAADGGGA